MIRRAAAIVALLLLSGCSETVHFRASDGRKLHGQLTPAENDRAPAVILVHGLYGEPAEWKDFAEDLHDAGFTTLAYASRSDHEPDPAVLGRDVVGAVRFLRDRRAGPISLVGSSVGAETVAFVLGSQPGLPVAGGVGLSPVRSPRIAALTRRGAFHPHDLLLISDQREAPAARRIRATDRYVAETVGHGVDLLADPTVRSRTLAWLKR